MFRSCCYWVSAITIMHKCPRHHAFGLKLWYLHDNACPCMLLQACCTYFGCRVAKQCDTVMVTDMPVLLTGHEPKTESSEAQYLPQRGACPQNPGSQASRVLHQALAACLAFARKARCGHRSNLAPQICKHHIWTVCRR